jgi:hypothetical protein
MEGIVHYELLERNLAVTAERCCQQFAVWTKQSSKNARVDDMEWGDSSTSALLSGPCPNGFPLLPLSPSNNLRGVSFNNDAELQNWLSDFFRVKPADFFKRGIENLPERWEAVVNNGGEYIIN